MSAGAGAEVTQLAEALDARLRAGAAGASQAREGVLEKRPGALRRERAAIRSAATAFSKEHPALGHDELVGLVEELWSRPVHECRMAAVELLDLYNRLLQAGDMALLERLLRDSRTWAPVDGLAASVVGALVDREPAAAARRARSVGRRPRPLDPPVGDARLLPALRGGEGDFERFCRFADGMLEENEFFIRKAIGWVLRDTARKRPAMVFDWLLPRAARASGMTVRAVEPLSEKQRTAVLSASAGRARGDAAGMVEPAGRRPRQPLPRRLARLGRRRAGRVDVEAPAVGGDRLDRHRPLGDGGEALEERGGKGGGGHPAGRQLLGHSLEADQLPGRRPGHGGQVARGRQGPAVRVVAGKSRVEEGTAQAGGPQRREVTSASPSSRRRGR